MRPISLLPNISKVFEICVNNSVLKLSTNKNLTNEKQFGFKYKHSTVNAINILMSHVNWNWNRKYCTGTCLIDMEKAFDNIWIPGLICKLIDYNFPQNLVILLHNMLEKRKITICRNTANSKEFILFNGLQQGTGMAPTLFNIYTLELLNKIENIISFADDIIVYNSGDTISGINSNLQASFDLVETYAENWHLKINTEKCETILFRPPVNKCSYKIRKEWKSFGIKSRTTNTSLKVSDTVKYLGIYLDKFLYFNDHVNRILEKTRKAFFANKSLFYSKYLKPKTKIILYQTIIRPVTTYGCPVWFNISPSYMEKIRVMERKILRVCTSLYRSRQSNFIKYFSNTVLYNTADINRIDNFIIHLIRNHIVRCTTCTEFNLIMAPYYSNPNYLKTTIESGFVPPEAFLYLDNQRIIQKEDGVPIFFHQYRRATSKAIILNES